MIGSCRYYLLILLLSFETFGFVRTRSSQGDKLYWDSSSIELCDFTNDGTYGILNALDRSSGAEVNSLADIITSGMGEWNGVSESSMSLSRKAGGCPGSPSSSSDGLFFNDLYFSSSSLYFGSSPSTSAVLAVTAVAFFTQSAPGKILEADVIVNRSKTFSDWDEDTIPSSATSRNFFIGDVLTHEFGHVLGFGHAQNWGSTMVYTVYRGQHTLHESDKGGLRATYPNTTSLGSISGKVIGGSVGNTVGIFGAQVMAISVNEGKVMSSDFSDADGTFTIGGLPLDDTYYLYSTRGNVVFANIPAFSPLPPYYTSAKSDFCSGGNFYRGSFYQGCSNGGKPLGIHLTSGDKNRDIGNLTIRCDLSPTYNSGDGLVTLSPNKTLGSEFGDAAVMEFTVGGVSDDHVFQIDTSGMVPGTNYPNANNLKVTLISSSTFSPTPIEITKWEDTTNTDSPPTYDDIDGGGADPGFNYDGDQNIILDQSVTASFAAGTYDLETLYVSPNDPSLYGTNTLWMFPVNDLIDPQPDGSTSYKEFYLAIVSAIDGAGDIVYPVSDSPENEAACVDASEAYAVAASVSESSGSSTLSSQDSGGIFSCGSIDLNPPSGGPGSGPMNMALGFMLGILVLGRRKSLKIRR